MCSFFHNIRFPWAFWRLGQISKSCLNKINLSFNSVFHKLFKIPPRMRWHLPEWLKLRMINNTRPCKPTGVLQHHWWECKTAQLPWKTFWEFLIKVNITADPAIPFLFIYPREMKAHIHKKAFIHNGHPLQLYSDQAICMMANVKLYLTFLFYEKSIIDFNAYEGF